MKHPDRTHARLAVCALTVFTTMMSSSIQAALTDLTTTPLGTSTNGTVVKPNILFILDGSGSMNSNFSPDNITANATCRTDSTGSTACSKSDPPFQADMFNGLAYNPQTRYQAGVNFSGTSRGDMTAAATSSWTSVPTDAYYAEEGVANTTMNITTSWFQNGWCAVSGCSSPRLNGVHNAVNGSFAYATPPKPAITGVVFSRVGTTVTGTKSGHNVAVNDVIDVVGAGSCSAQQVRVSAVTANTFSFTWGDFSVPSCSAVTGTVNFSVRGYPETTGIALAPTSAVTRSGTTVAVTFPGHGFIVGDLVDITGGSAVLSLTSSNVTKLASFTSNKVSNNKGTVQVDTAAATGLVNGSIVTVSGGGSSCNAANVAVTIVNATRFTYTVSSNSNCSGTYTISPTTVTVSTSVAHGLTTGDVVDVLNGGAACVASTVGVTVISTTQFTYTASGGGACSGIYGIYRHSCNTSATGTPITSLVGVAPSYTGFTVTLSNNALACAGTYNVSRRPANVSKTANTNPVYYTLSPTEYCSDLHLTDCVAANQPTTISIPGRPNGGNVSFTYPAYVRYCSSAALAAAPPLAASAAPSTPPSGSAIGCVDKYYPPTYVYARYGTFTRGDIVPTTAVYGNRPNRADCAAAPNCTYAEEMTNFANWLAYYRRRIQAMKTSVGLSFNALDDRYRVGFMLISFNDELSAVKCTASPCSPNTEFVPIDVFGTAQKQMFYSAMYGQVPANGTPLRRALTRAGRYFAHQTSGINGGLTDDPVQYSCQQNFALLTTDGMWKSYTPGDGVQLDGTTPVGNQDNNLNDPSGMVSRAAGTYDGGCPAGDTSTTGGCAGTLADVAMYYYKTDLRDASLGNATGALGADVSANNVPTTDADKAPWQHMVTFALALADGLMTWQPDYQTSATGDYKNITTGASGCWWSGSGACNWPTVIEDQPTALDDLWHAAVNGHGQYFHAGDAQSLTNGLVGALAGMSARTAAAAASATSSPNITQQDNVIFSTTYETVDWSGQMVAQYIDTTTGTVLPTALWQTQAALDGQVSATGDSRRIYTIDANVHLQNFDYNAFTPTEKAWLDNACTPVGRLSQCGTLSAVQQAWINNGLNMAAFIRGATQNEGTILRDRKHTLGDTVDATPVYVRAPMFNFSDASPSYLSFKSAQASRSPVIYLAANDGMLHAVDARVGAGTSGQELWAYIPRMLIPSLYKLADSAYASKHAFFVDGSPTVMDAVINGAWRTVLVGGLNNGGRGFYALDVTDPNNPRALWEFCSDSTLCAVSDPNLGRSYGNPIITKLLTGRWVAIVTSGYNNVSPGDGMGHLYVLDLATGSKLYDISNGTGSTTTPSGLSKLSAWADNFMQNNTAQYLYGGDLRGNLWRYDFTQLPPVVQQMGTLTDATNRPQSVSTRPELASINGQRVLFVGTGRYLGLSDLTDPASWTPPSTDAWQQSLYAIKDTGGNLGNLRTNGNLVHQTLVAQGALSRTTSTNPVDWTTKNGWYLDFNPDGSSPGERVNLDPQLVMGTLNLKTNVPSINACVFGGDSWAYQLSYLSGTFVSSAPGQTAGQKIAGATTVGFVIVGLPSGGLKDITTIASGDKRTFGVNLGGGNGQGRRVGWREITQ